MSVVYALSDLKKYLASKSRADVSNIIFKLHRLVGALLIGSSILTTSRQFFGEPIHCHVGGSIPLNVFQSYCFMTATYTIPRMVSNTTSSHPGVSTGVVNAGGDEDGTVYHNYYQWVCLLLAVQAGVCYLPYAAWKRIEGGRVGKLLAKVSQDPLTETPVSDQVASVSEFMISHSGWFNSCAIKLLLCQLFALVLTVGQMYIMDLVLANQFLSLGTNLRSLEMLNEALTRVFPKVVKCSMTYHGVSGNIVNNSGMCTLPINIINEKIYLMLWMCFLATACVSIFSLVYQTLYLVSPGVRKLEMQVRSRTTPYHVVLSVVNQLSYGDLVLLKLISTNTDTAQFTALLEHLSGVSILPRHRRSVHHESYVGQEKEGAAMNGRKEA